MNLMGRMPAHLTEPERDVLRSIGKAAMRFIIDPNMAAFGVMAMNLDITFDYSMPAPAGISIKGGLSLKVNPPLWAAFGAEVHEGFMEHELGHIVQRYWTRAERLKRRAGDKFNYMKANIVADAAINQYIKPEKLPGAVFPEQLEDKNKKPLPRDKTMEFYYKNWHHEPQEGQQGEGEGEEDGTSTGEGGSGKGKGKGKKKKDAQGGGGKKDQDQLKTIDDHSGMQGASQEDERKAEGDVLDMIDAIKASGAGNVAGHMTEILEETYMPRRKFDPIKLVRKYIIHFGRARETWSWARINRRTGELGDYQEVGLGKVVFAVDTSGSMDRETLIKIAGVCKQSKGLIKSEIWVVECDTQNNAVYRFDDARIKKLEGRGGTHFCPPFEWAAQQGDIRFLFYFTDGDNFDGEALAQMKPRFPVLWVLCGSHGGGGSQPFGREVVMEDNTVVADHEKVYG